MISFKFVSQLPSLSLHCSLSLSPTLTRLPNLLRWRRCWLVPSCCVCCATAQKCLYVCVLFDFRFESYQWNCTTHTRTPKQTHTHCRVICSFIHKCIYCVCVCVFVYAPRWKWIIASLSLVPFCPFLLCFYFISFFSLPHPLTCLW